MNVQKYFSIAILIIAACSVSAHAETTSEAQGLTMDGTKVFTFRSRSVIGSKEGEAEGSTTTRDETLRLNISGRAADTDVQATIISTSTTGTEISTQQEDKISISLKRGSTEAYYGDFTAEMDGLEFAKIDKVLSGLRLSGEYDKWGFKAIASTPQGESKTIRTYGDGTQGPYSLGFSPVVIDSERVWVDGVSQKRGDDYDIDYESGSVTFRKNVIIATSIIKIDFDYRSTPYHHSTYGLRLKGSPMENLKLGITYLNDSDSKSNAEETRASMSINPIDPSSHTVIGVDGSYSFGPALRIESEAAYSERNPNIIASSSNEVVHTGRAMKINTTSELGPVFVATRMKRIGPQFQSIGDADPKQDLWLVGGDIAYKPNNVFYSEGKYDNESFIQSGVRYANNFIGAKTKVNPNNDSSFSYSFKQLEESNDPVSGDEFNRLTIRNAGDVSYKYGFLRHVLSGSHEKRLSRTPSEESVVYRTVGYGFSTLGLDKISVSGDFELKDTEDPTEDIYLTKTSNLNISVSPAREYFVSASFNNVDDEKEGITTVTDLGYRAEPMNEIKTEGKYTVSSLKEDFGATPEVVSKQVGSFRLDVRPIKEIRLRHTYKPDFTIMQPLGLLSYNNNSNQSEIIWSPFRQYSAGIIYRVDDMFSLYKEAIAQEIIDEKSASKSTTLTFKAAPVRILSLEFNYTYDDLFDTELSSFETLSYEDTEGFVKEFEAAARTSLSEWFSLDSRYMKTENFAKSTEPDNCINELEQIGSIKGIWNIDESWSFSLSGAYSETTDFLDNEDPLTYTVSPGIGFVFRQTSVLRIEGDYIYSKSYLGADTEKHLFGLNAKYDVNQYVHLSVNLEQEQSLSPDYQITDILFNLEIDL